MLWCPPLSPHISPVHHTASKMSPASACALLSHSTVLTVCVSVRRCQSVKMCRYRFYRDPGPPHYDVLVATSCVPRTPYYLTLNIYCMHLIGAKCRAEPHTSADLRLESGIHWTRPVVNVHRHASWPNRLGLGTPDSWMGWSKPSRAAGCCTIFCLGVAEPEGILMDSAAGR